MTEKKKILLQLDTDQHPSVFDRVVAVDAGVDHVFSYGGVNPTQVRDLVYGALFTRGGEDLKRTAVFVGGSDVSQGEALVQAARKAFFGPFRVSLLLDSNGANTTAAAAAVVAARHVKLEGSRALVLGSSGPVGRRVARLLARAGAQVIVGSRLFDRAAEVAAYVQTQVEGAHVSPAATASPDQLPPLLEGASVIVAAGGPGVCLLPRDLRKAAASVRVIVDLNAVPPEGLEGVKGTDAGVDRDGQIAYGALGVGGLKMKIHRAAIAELFESNLRDLDVEQVFEIGKRLS